MVERDTAALGEIIGKKDFEQFLRMQAPAIASIDRSTLIWKMTSTQIERLRREARQEIRTMHELNSKRQKLEKQLKAEKAKPFKNKIKIEHLESLIRSLGEMIKATRKILDGIGKLVATNLELRSLVTTDHEFVQLINTNIREEPKSAHYE